MPPEVAAPPPLGRVIAFLLLVISVELWTNAHRGFGLTNPGRFTATVGLVTAAWALAGKVVEKSGQEAVLARLRRASSVLLSPAVLVTAWVVFAWIALTRSTVVVVPDGDRPPAMRLTAADGGEELAGRRSSDRGPLRFAVGTTPFGRPFRLKVEGYAPAVVEAHSVFVKTVRVDGLRRSPSVLVRPSLQALRHLDDGGHLTVSDGKGELATGQGRCSFLLGIAQAVPQAFLTNWDLELTALGLEGRPRAQTLLDWRRPRLLVPARELEEGTTVEAQVKTAGGIPVATGRVQLGTDPLTDLPLTDLP